jgi:pimeloyl-ACP methyl ester carboxylesterase
MINQVHPSQQGFFPSGNRMLYAERWGTHSPTVIYETGSTMPGTNDPGWRPIRDAITAEASVFLYDRAGLGRSDPAPLPRPLSAFTADLIAVLQASASPPPYVLVGGSFGGMLALHYASLFPEDTRGVLLVDSTHPEHNTRSLSVLPPESPNEPNALRGFRSLLLQENNAPLETNEWEGLDVPASIAEAQAAWNLRDIPLIVLTAGLDEWEEGFPEDVADRYEQVWLDLQNEMAALSTRSKHVIVEDSDHIIHFRRPDIVIRMIRELCAIAS